MMEEFRAKTFRDDSLALIDKCNATIARYAAMGIDALTLRQLYYQLVTDNTITNEERSYKRLGAILSDARLAGLVDWDAIEDRVRVPKKAPDWDSVAELVESAVQQYRLPRWRGQDHYVELWVEKDAIANILVPITRRYHITLMVNRGYSSQSAMYDSANRFKAEQDAKSCVLLYLGDLDPSGEDMVRDIDDRLHMFGAEVDVEKIALTMAQVKRYRPPPNPAKRTDSRAASYIERFGNSSWEVDALPPNVLTKLVEQSIDKYVNHTLMDAIKAEEDQHRAILRKAVADL